MKLRNKGNPLMNYYLIALVLFVVLFLVTIVLFLIVKQKRDNYTQQVFENRILFAKEEIESRLKNYILILESTRALFVSSDTVTREEWKRFVSALDLQKRYPGSQGIGYAVFLRPENLESFEARFQKEFDKKFRIWPAGDRPVYSSIIYLDPPIFGNQKALGFDMFSNPIRKDAVMRAIDKNEAIISKKVKLVTDTSKSENPGFIIYLPKYKKPAETMSVDERRKNVVGVIFSPFTAHELMGQILKDQYSDFEIEIFDESLSKENLLFDKDSSISYFKDNSKFSKTTSIRLGDHTWALFFGSTPKFESLTEQYFPFAILIGGIIISLLIFALTITLLKNRHKSELIRTALRKQNEQLTVINSDLDNFVFTASHDLKAPISNLEGLTELIKEEMKEMKKNENLKNLVNLMNESISKLENTITDLTDVSRINVEEKNYEPVDLKPIIEEVMFVYKKTIEESKATITMDLQEPAIKFSKKNLRSVIDNLLSNALKYKSPERPPKIDIESKKKNGGVLLTVSDNGLGIKSNQKEKIFGMFQRAHTHVPGTGVGLYIVKRIMDNSGGSIKLESEEGKGSTFTCHFDGNKKNGESVSNDETK